MTLAQNRKCAIVTGASGGIGRAIATGLAGDGLDLVVHYNRDKQGAEETADLVRKAGGRASLIQVALDKPDATELLVSHSLEFASQIVVVVNNAAVLWTGDPRDITERELLEMFAVNVFASYRLISRAGHVMQEGGRIINLSSDAAVLPRPFAAAYAASKAALNSITISFAEWLAHRGITVNGVAPGPVQTEMMASVISDEKLLLAASRSSAQGRIAVTGDIVPVVRFLARPESQWINGQTIEVTGGRVASW